jgi:putative transposase
VSPILRVRTVRSSQRKVPCGANDEQALTDDIVALAKQ